MSDDVDEPEDPQDVGDGSEDVAVVEVVDAEDSAELVDQERAIGARIYELALEGLADQERTVGNIRNRAAPLLAGGLVGAGLLARPAFERGHPDGVDEWIAVVAGTLGGLGLLVAVVLLSLPSDLGFSIRSSDAYKALFDAGITTQPEADLALAAAVDVRRDANVAAVTRLAGWLVVAAVAFAVEIAGFAVGAALASRGDGHSASNKPAAAAPRDKPAATRKSPQAAGNDLQHRKEERHAERNPERRNQARPTPTR